MKILNLIFILVLSSCFSSEGPEIIHISGPTMGTTYNVKVVVPQNYQSADLTTAINERLIEVNKSMSTYIGDSEISKFNKLGSNIEFKISDDFYHVLSHALKISKKTSGSFDPTIGPLVNLWGFGPTGERKVPKKSLIDETLKNIGTHHLVLNEANKSIKKLNSKVYIDLSASAKGFGVDAILDLLIKRGFENAMVEIGGEIKTIGKSLTRPWKIGVESPSPDNLAHSLTKVIKLEGVALATSGDYRNFFKQDGKRYSHTMNYKTGEPVEGALASVSVISDTCMDADAWATALMAMGVEKGFEYASLNGIKAFFIYKNNKAGELENFKTLATEEFETATR